jgi:hypothetical protein
MKVLKVSNGVKVFIFWLAVLIVLVALKIFVFPG